MATPDHRDRMGSERHLHHHSIAAIDVMQHPNVDGVLGARDVSFQMPLPHPFWLHPPYWMPPNGPSGTPQETEAA